MDRSPGFGSATYDERPLQTWLPFGFVPEVLNRPYIAARRTVLQKVRGWSFEDFPQFVSAGFQVLFHSPPGVLFTFPSRYYTLSVTGEYLALRGGPRSFPQYSSCIVVLWIPVVHFNFVYGTVTLFGLLSQNSSTRIHSPYPVQTP